MKRVLFAFFNMSSPISYSFGVAYLSAVLRHAGFFVETLHLNDHIIGNNPVQAVLDKIVESQPDALCCSAISTQQSILIPVLEGVKKAFGNKLLVVVGGLLPTFDPGSVSNLCHFTVRGEAENLLPALLNSKSSLSSSVITVGHYTDISLLPEMDMDAFDFKEIVSRKAGWVEMMIGRGCPFRCSYCFNQEFVTIFGVDDYIRAKPINLVLDELTALIARCEARVVNFVDDVFTYDMNYLKEFLPKYKEVIGLPFLCATRAEFIDESVATLLKISGCRLVRVGLESGSSDLRRKELNRKFDDTCFVSAVKILGDVGIELGVFNIIGIPGETEKDILKTLELNAQAAPATSKRTVLLPFRGTEIYRRWKHLIAEDILSNQVEYNNCRSVFKFGTEWLDMIKYYQGNWDQELSKMTGIKYDYRWEGSVAVREDYKGILGC